MIRAAEDRGARVPASAAAPDPETALASDACRRLEAAEGKAGLTFGRVRAETHRHRFDPAVGRFVPAAADARSILDGMRAFRGEARAPRGNRDLDLMLQEADRAEAALRACMRALGREARTVFAAAGGAGAARPAATPGAPGIWVAPESAVVPPWWTPRWVEDALRRTLAGRSAAVSDILVSPEDVSQADLLLPAVLVSCAASMRPDDMRCCLRRDDALLTGYGVMYLEADRDALACAVSALVPPETGSPVRLDFAVAALRAWLEAHGHDAAATASFSAGP